MNNRRVGSLDGRRFSEGMSCSGGAYPATEHRHMIAEMRSQNFDSIRFASYRLANKLRFIQKKTNLHLVDIWNVIEAFRENGFNTLDHRHEIGVSRIESLVCGLFYQLNKRLPTTQQVNVAHCTGLLLNWLLHIYDGETSGRLPVFAIKVCLAILCAGKLMDKLRYIFSQISDANGHMIASKFQEFMRNSLALPASVYESPSFAYSEGMTAAIFSGLSKVTVNDFLDVMLSDPGPPALVWLPLIHRLASVEGVEHPITCEGCNRHSFGGLRYKCQKCYNYQLCQDCFWNGITTKGHTLEHEMKEYAAFKSPGKQLGHSIRKSFRCVPDKRSNDIPHFPNEPEKPLNLSHIVPPSPMLSHNGFQEVPHNSFDVASIHSGSNKSPTKQTSSLESQRVDDEHRLIARYAARLAADANHAARSPSELSLSLDTSRAQRELINQLEAKNREIMREIECLRRQQVLEEQALHSQQQQNPTLLAELKGLRSRKHELEQHLSTLQESRRELMVQLEGLMKLLKNHQASPRSTPTSSPRSGSTKSPTLSMTFPAAAASNAVSSNAASGGSVSASSSRSAPSTPGSSAPPGDSLTGVGGDVRLAFGQSAGGSSRSLRSDLLVAADSVTNAMSSLVKELNSGDSDNEEKLGESESFAKNAGRSYLSAGDELESHGRTDDDSYIRTDDEEPDLYEGVEHLHTSAWRPGGTSGVGATSLAAAASAANTDDESYVRTDDEAHDLDDNDEEEEGEEAGDGGGGGGGAGVDQWEDALKRWVNR